MSKLMPGEARVEFLACVNEVRKMIDEAYTAASIYRMYIKENKISMSYVRFSYYINSVKKNNKVIKKNDINNKKNTDTYQDTYQQKEKARQVREVKAFGAREEDTEPREPRINNKNI